MKGIPQGRYTLEFRQEAVKLVAQENLGVAEVSRRLELPTNTVHNWLKKYREGKLGEVCQNYRPLTEVEIENARLKKAFLASINGGRYFTIERTKTFELNFSLVD